MNSIIKKMLKGMKRQNGWGRKYRYAKYYMLARRNGVVDFRLDRMANEYTDDYFSDTGVERKEKAWYYERGIQSYKVNYYGLTKQNYSDYISDWQFYKKAAYVNAPFSRWFDQKLSTFYVLSPFKEYMPRHYYYIKSGKILGINCKEKFYYTSDDVLSLSCTVPLALKMNVGGHSRGFFKLAGTSRGYQLNGRLLGPEDAGTFISSLQDYLITEFCIPSRELLDLCGKDAFAVLRVLTIYDSETGPHITGAIIRLGCKEAGIITDAQGTIYAGIDLETGRFFDSFIRGGRAEVKTRIPLERHPDTNKTLNGFILPRFAELKQLVLAIAAHISMTPYLVFDIIPTDQGFKIAEINSHGLVHNIEPFYPFNLNPNNKRLFQADE